MDDFSFNILFLTWNVSFDFSLKNLYETLLKTRFYYKFTYAFMWIAWYFWSTFLPLNLWVIEHSGCHIKIQQRQVYIDHSSVSQEGDLFFPTSVIVFFHVYPKTVYCLAFTLIGLSLSYSKTSMFFLTYWDHPSIVPAWFLLPPQFISLFATCFLEQRDVEDNSVLKAEITYLEDTCKYFGTWGPRIRCTDCTRTTLDPCAIC